MTGKLWAHILIATCFGSAIVLAEGDAVEPPPFEIVISVAEQKLALVKDGGLVRKYPISTSKFGLGDSYNSYKTPLGRLRICDKIGDNLALGAVLKSRNATGEILPVNSPGRDPIVTRILWLDGLEAGNSNAKSRGIYIHGTVEESRLGQPVSYGCIRMRSVDVVELFDETPVGTPVEIITEKLPRFRKASPKPDLLLASNETITTKIVGPHGQVIVRTVRGGEKGSPTRALFADSNPVSSPAPQPSAAKTSETQAKLIARTTPPPAPPIDLGPKVVLTPPPPPEPLVMLSLKDSILDAGLPQVAKNGPAQPVQPAAPVQPVPTSSAPVVENEPAESLQNMALQVADAHDPFASATETSEAAPLDRLSAHVLHPPTPQFRLAFRTTAPAPEL